MRFLVDHMEQLNLFYPNSHRKVGALPYRNDNPITKVPKHLTIKTFKRFL